LQQNFICAAKRTYHANFRQDTTKKGTFSIRLNILYFFNPPELLFCSCELRLRITESVVFLCFNELPDIFAVMNCSVLALSAVLCSGVLTYNADNLCSLQGHILQQRARRVHVK